MSASPSSGVPAFLRRLLRRLARLAPAIARGPLRRHLLRARFGPWAATWLGGPAIVRWRGVRVEVDPGEAHGFHVFVHGDYGGAELDACIAHCRGRRVFVDVGAHIGLISLSVARACPGVQVVAFEADPAIASWFRRNLALNPDLAPRVTLVEMAAVDHDGEVAFAPSAHDFNVGTGHVTTGEARHARRVPGVALGPWLSRHGLAADVVKIDVEGGELEALAGLFRDGPPPRVILVETHRHLVADPATFNKRVLAAFTERGYVVDRLDRGTWTRVARADEIGERSHLRARRGGT
jgi:FkbM family methyltransferase